LVDIIPSAAGNLMLGIPLNLHVMANFVVISGTTVASAIIHDKILNFVVVMGGFLRQALRLKETVLGKEYPDTLTSMYNLAYVLSIRKRFSEANTLYQRVLNGYGKTLTPSKPWLSAEASPCDPCPRPPPSHRCNS
jgi:hypothetical protein